MRFYKIQAVFFMCVYINVGYVTTQTFGDVYRLRKYLFDESRYDKGIRPVLNQTTILQVQFFQAILKLESIDITYGKLTVLSHCPMFWFDELLTWNSTQFGGITRLVVTHDQIWYPEMYILTAANNDNAILAGDITSVSINNEGMVTMLQGGVFETSCETEAFVFPFDSHVCSFRFISSHEVAAELVMVPFVTEVDRTDFIENKEWILESSSISQYDMKALNGSWHVSGIETKLVVTRRPMLTILRNLPVLMLMTISLLTSFVPVSSGERMSFAITVFLSFLFLGGSVMDNLPRDSIHISLCSYLMFSGNMTCSIGVVWSIFIVNISKLSAENNNIHDILVRVTLLMRKKNNIGVGKIKRLENKVCTIDEYNYTEDGKVNNIDKSLDTESKPSETHIKDIPEAKIVNWEEVAEALDKIFFYINLVVTVTVLVSFFIRWYTYKSS